MEEKEAESPLTSPRSAAATTVLPKRARELDTVEVADEIGSPAHKHLRRHDGSRGSPLRSPTTGLTPIRTKPLPPSRSLDSDISAGLTCLPLPLDAGVALVINSHANLPPCTAAGTTAQSRETGADEHEPSTPRASSICTSIFSPTRQRGNTSLTSPEHTTPTQQAALVTFSPQAQGYQAAESSPLARPAVGAAACRRLSFCFQSPGRASPASPACASTPSAPAVPSWFRPASAGRAAAMQAPMPNASPSHCGVPERMATGRSPHHMMQAVHKQQQQQQQQQQLQGLRDRLPSFRLWTQQQQEGQQQQDQPASSSPALLPGSCLPWAVIGKGLSVHAPRTCASLSRSSSWMGASKDAEHASTPAAQGSPAVAPTAGASPSTVRLPSEPSRTTLQVPKAITPGTWRLGSGRAGAPSPNDALPGATPQGPMSSSMGPLPSLPFDRTSLGRYSLGRREGSGGVSPMRDTCSRLAAPAAGGSALASCSNQEPGDGPADVPKTNESRFAKVRMDRTAQLRMVLASAMAALSAPDAVTPSATAVPAPGQAATQAPACSPAKKAQPVDPDAAAQAYPQLVARAFQDWLQQCASSPADGGGSLSNPKQ